MYQIILKKIRQEIMQKSIYIILILILFSVSCKNESTPDKAEIISKLQASSKLSTVEFVVTKVISAEKKKFFSNKYFFAETKAFIKAGIDLSKIEESDVIIKGQKINILLPAIEILEFSYPPDAFDVVEEYTSSNGLFDFNTISLQERDALYQAGEQDIRNNIKNLGITENAERNTRLFFSNMLRNAGFKEIYIKFKTNNELSVQKEKK